MRIAGIDEYYTYTRRGEIPAQWARFASRTEAVPHTMGDAAYGVSHAMGEQGFRYLTGVEVEDATDVPAGYDSIRLPAQRYAVFTHRGSVATLSDTCEAIAMEWLPASGLAPAAEGVMLERYGEKFDPATLSGEVEVWVAVAG
jgi:AraC family transcriptional regulator